jgi:hypothetical protein
MRCRMNLTKYFRHQDTKTRSLIKINIYFNIESRALPPGCRPDGPEAGLGFFTSCALVPLWLFFPVYPGRVFIVIID